MKKGLFLCAILLLAAAIPATACEYECGDANIDGQVNVGDAVYIMDYLYNGGPPPLDIDLECGNWDNYLTLTVHDVWRIIKYVFSEGWPPDECPPTGPPIDPQVDSTSTLYYTDWIPSGSSSAVIALTLHKDIDTRVYGVSFPLRIRVHGEIPTIDSVVFAYDHFVGYTVYEETGDVAIGMVPLLTDYDWIAKQVAFVYVSMPPEPNQRTVTMEWVNLTPVQAPTEDSSLIPMYVNSYGGAAKPLLEPHCCLVPGDANTDGMVNVGDAVFIIGCVFLDCLGHECENQIDANCDGSWNLGDAVYLINYIFRGGPLPCCI